MDAELNQRFDVLMAALTELGERTEAGFAAAERRFDALRAAMLERFDGVDARLILLEAGRQRPRRA